MKKATSTKANNSQQINNIKALIKKELTTHREEGDNYPHFTTPLGKWSAGFEVVALDNTKPSTIQAKADPTKRNILVFFNTRQHLQGLRRYWGDFLVLAEWNTEKGKAQKLCTSTRGTIRQRIRSTYTNQDAEETRKNALLCFLVVVPNLYEQADKEKQEQRAKTWRNLNTYELAQNYKKGITQPTEEEKSQGAWLVYRVSSWYSNTRELLDKCYNNLTVVRHALKNRARKLHEERAKANWLSRDHSAIINELRQMEEEESQQIAEILKVKKYDTYTRATISNLMESIERIEGTIERIQEGKITDTDTLAKRLKGDYLNLKKCRLLATHYDDPKYYGWSWWEDDPTTQGLRNHYKIGNDPDNEYYHFVDSKGNATY